MKGLTVSMENSIGTRIKNRRLVLNLTQMDIASATSLSSGNLSCIENGKYLPSAPSLIELSQILGCSIDWLLTGKEYCKTSPSVCISGDAVELCDYFMKMDAADQYEMLVLARTKMRKYAD